MSLGLRKASFPGSKCSSARTCANPCSRRRPDLPRRVGTVAICQRGSARPQPRLALVVSPREKSPLARWATGPPVPRKGLSCRCRVAIATPLTSARHRHFDAPPHPPLLRRPGSPRAARAPPTRLRARSEPSARFGRFRADSGAARSGVSVRAGERSSGAIGEDSAHIVAPRYRLRQRSETARTSSGLFASPGRTARGLGRVRAGSGLTRSVRYRFGPRRADSAAPHWPAARERARRPPSRGARAARAASGLIGNRSGGPEHARRCSGRLGGARLAGPPARRTPLWRARGGGGAGSATPGPAHGAQRRRPSRRTARLARGIRAAAAAAAGSGGGGGARGGGGGGGSNGDGDRRRAHRDGSPSNAKRRRGRRRRCLRRSGRAALPQPARGSPSRGSGWHGEPLSSAPTPHRVPHSAPSRSVQSGAAWVPELRPRVL